MNFDLKRTPLFIVALFFCASIFLPSPRCYAMEKDKIQHAGVSATMSGSIYLTARSYGVSRWRSGATAMALTLLVGVLKETTDIYFDNQDMRANFFGASTGIILPLTFNF